MKSLGFVLIAVLMLGAVSAGAVIHFVSQDTVELTVTHRERVPGKDNTSRYMIWATVNGQNEVFENTDSLLALKWNSADVYGQMMPGAQCEALVNGYRIPWLSMNRNILRVTCTQPG